MTTIISATATAMDYDVVIQAMLKSWKTFPQKKRIESYTAAAKTYEDLEKRARASAILEAVGDKAINTDDAFRNIREKFERFTKNHQERFLDLETEYILSWNKLFKDWAKAFKKSQEYAILTAAEYKDRYVAVIFESAGKVDLNDPEAVRREQDCLRRYGEEPPPSQIPENYENSFKELRQAVVRFQAKFSNYLAEKGEEINEELVRLKEELTVLVEHLHALNKTVNDWTTALIFTSWDELIGVLISGTGLVAKIKACNIQVWKVQKKKNKMDSANEGQAGLTGLAANFTTVCCEFDMVQGNLHSLTKIWSDMRVNSIKLSYLLEKAVNGGNDAETQEFKLALLSAQKAAEPLHDSLLIYAKRIEEQCRAYNGIN
ncbi:hypothetical protein BDZ94DRAFT_1294429 [Collybia nuda]|uniref:Uncharacterized protein n=1 Tax=Collybia nuda TaxID=64659 RepID=A0A9P5YGU9_9AGAR|nr:hypothetical protein BDZ94DRAFT_1294429 [Collybia nuda]